MKSINSKPGSIPPQNYSSNHPPPGMFCRIFPQLFPVSCPVVYRRLSTMRMFGGTSPSLALFQQQATTLDFSPMHYVKLDLQDEKSTMPYQACSTQHPKLLDLSITCEQKKITIDASILPSNPGVHGNTFLLNKTVCKNISTLFR